MIRVACYIDGFNLYHAIDDISRASRGVDNYLKWVDLGKLMRIFTDPKAHTVTSVKYFSAYANWLPDQAARHRLYVAALKSGGIEPIMGRFKDKEIYCKRCKTTFWGHEEKESDVNLATHLLNDAHLNTFDQAFVVSRDSDLCSPIRLLRLGFPSKRVKVIAPPGRSHSKELWALAHSRATIAEEHLEACLLPERILDGGGNEVCVRPSEYDPPA